MIQSLKKSFLILSFFLLSRSFAIADNEELQYIAEINEIIERIVAPSAPEELTQNFHVFGNSLTDAQIIFLAEQHNRESVLVNRARILHQMFKPGDALLLEGVFSGESQNCDDIVFWIHRMKIFNRTGKSYFIENFDTLTEIDQRYRPIWLKTKDRLNLDKLSFVQGPCLGWDFPLPAESRFESGKIRNTVMVSQIGRQLKTIDAANRIFVVAGVFHLPSGDLEGLKVKRLTEPEYVAPLEYYFSLGNKRIEELDFETFYQLTHDLKKETCPAAWQFQKAAGTGSTRVVYDFVKDKKYAELIPKELLTLPNSHAIPCRETDEIVVENARTKGVEELLVNGKRISKCFPPFKLTLDPEKLAAHCSERDIDEMNRFFLCAMKNGVCLMSDAEGWRERPDFGNEMDSNCPKPVMSQECDSAFNLIHSSN